MQMDEEVLQMKKKTPARVRIFLKNDVFRGGRGKIFDENFVNLWKLEQIQHASSVLKHAHPAEMQYLQKKVWYEPS